MVEIAAGVICIGICIYSVMEFFDCKPGATYCKPLTALQVAIFSVPGIAFLAAGVCSFLTKRFKFRTIQLAMIICVGLFGFVLFGFIYYGPKIHN